MMKVNSFGAELKRFAPPLFAKRKETLYILFIPTSCPGNVPETFFARVEENLRDSFYSYRGGIIGALKRATASASFMLHSRQVQGIIFCMAEGKEEAYLALAGPIIALLRREGKIKSFPGGQPSPGETTEPKPRFLSFPMESETTLLLVPAVEELTLQHLEKAAKTGKGEKLLASVQEIIGPLSWGVVLEPEPVSAIPTQPLWKRLKALLKQIFDFLTPVEKPVKKPIVAQNNWAKIVAAAIPLVVLFLMLLAYFQRVRVENSRISQLLKEAQAAISQAASAPDEVAQREALKTAARAIKEARLIRPMAPQLQEVEKAFQEQYDRAYRIIRNCPSVTLVRFREDGVKPHRIAVDGRDIYILDTGADKIYLYQLNEIGDALINPENPLVLMGKGQVVEDVVVSELMDMTPYSSPQPGMEKGLLILDSSANLYRIAHPWGTIRHLSLAPGFHYPDRMKTLDRRLYILDRGRGQIWRYIPEQNGYPSPPTPYFPRAINMEGVRDFALDGYVYLLMANGKIQKFLGGNQVPFEVEPLDKPLVNPSVIFTFPEEELERPRHPLYIADPEQKRVLELDKNGRLLRQFVLQVEEPLEILDFIVDEKRKTAFVLTGRSLLFLFLP